MTETALPVPLDEMEDENQMILNDLEFSQKRSEFLQNYRKLLIEFSAKCVCNQNKPLINSIESLETQYKQLFNTDDEIECKPEVFGSKNDFQEIKEMIGLETDCESAANPNDSISLATDREKAEESYNEFNDKEENVTETTIGKCEESDNEVIIFDDYSPGYSSGIPSQENSSEVSKESNTSAKTKYNVSNNGEIFTKTKLKTNDKTNDINNKCILKILNLNNGSEKSGNSALVFDKIKNIILRKPAADIDRRHESLIEKLVLKEGDTTLKDDMRVKKGLCLSSSSTLTIPENKSSVEKIWALVPNLQNKVLLKKSGNKSSLTIVPPVAPPFRSSVPSNVKNNWISSILAQQNHGPPLINLKPTNITPGQTPLPMISPFLNISQSPRLVLIPTTTANPSVPIATKLDVENNLTPVNSSATLQMNSLKDTQNKPTKDIDTFSESLKKLKSGEITSFICPQKTILVYIKPEISKYKEKSFKYRCIECWKESTNMGLISSHIDRVHKREGVRIQLEDLNQIVHSVDCAITPLQMNRKLSVIKRNLKDPDTGQKKLGPILGYKCNYPGCDFIGLIDQSLDSHFAKHKWEGVYNCDFCHFNCLTSTSTVTEIREKHMRAVHTKQFRIAHNNQEQSEDQEQTLSLSDLDNYTNSIHKLLNLESFESNTDQMINNNNKLSSEFTDSVSTTTLNPCVSLNIINSSVNTNCDKIANHISTEPKFINLVSTQSSNTSSYKYLCQPVVSQSPHIKFQIPRNSNFVPKGVPSALVMPPFKRPPTLVPIVNLPSTLSTPIIIPEGSNLYFVPNETQPLSNQLGTNQMTQNNSETHLARNINSKPNEVLTKKRLQKDPVFSELGSWQIAQHFNNTTNATKERTLFLREGVRLLEKGTIDSFILENHELCQGFRKTVVLEEGREESTVMFRCLKCGRENNRKNILNHIDSTHKIVPILKLKQILESGDCFLSPSETYEMCSVIRSKCVNQENGMTEVGPEIGLKCNYTDCPFITNVVSCKSNISQHLRIHELGKTFECDICHKMFGNQQKLSQHKKVVHLSKNWPIIKCVFEGCNYQTHISSHFLQHKETHRSDRSFICLIDGCLSKFKTKSELIRHQKRHLNLVFECNWPGCNKTYSSSKSLKEHKLTKHEPHLEVRCDLCPKVFKTKLRVAAHKNLFHNFNNKPWIKCPHCPYKTIQEYQLRIHSFAHKTRRPFKCDQIDCNKAFKSERSLEKHKNFTHKDERPYPCEWPGCDFAFKLKSHMKRHMKNTHLNNNNIRFFCDYCDNSFKYKGDLNRHIRREH